MVAVAKRTGKRSNLGLACGLIGLLWSGAARAEVRVAIVDLQKAVTEMSDGRKALTDLQSKADKKKKELEARRDEIQKASEELKRQESAGALRPEAAQKRRQELEQKAMQFQETVMRTEQEFQQEQMKATKPLEDRVVRAIAAIATTNRFTMVLNSAAVVWQSSSENDITNEVIRKANDVKVPTAPAGAPTGAAAPGTPPPAIAR